MKVRVLLRLIVEAESVSDACDAIGDAIDEEALQEALDDNHDPVRVVSVVVEDGEEDTPA